MKKVIKGRYLGLIVEGILFVIWNILVWVLSATIKGIGSANVFFWAGYFFTVLAFAATAVVMLLVKVSKNATYSVLSPTYFFGIVYFAVTVIMNSVLIAFGFGWLAPVAAVLVPNLVIFLLYVAAVIVSIVMIARTEKVDDAIDVEYAAMKGLGIKVGTIAFSATDDAVKRALAQLRDDLDASDPIGRPQTAAAEHDIEMRIDEIASLVSASAAPSTILSKIVEVEGVLRERNSILKSLK